MCVSALQTLNVSLKKCFTHNFLQECGLAKTSVAFRKETDKSAKKLAKEKVN